MMSSTPGHQSKRTWSARRLIVTLVVSSPIIIGVVWLLR